MAIYSGFEPRCAASIVAMSIFFISIIASNARLAAAVSESVIACVRAIGVICQDNPHLSLHQPHSLSLPPFPTIADSEAADLVAFVRTLRPRSNVVPTRSRFALTDGRALDGLVLNRSHADVQLLGGDQKIHLLRPESGDRYRAVTSQADWPSYNGGPNGSRYSTLAQIDRSNVERLAPNGVILVDNVLWSGRVIDPTADDDDTRAIRAFNELVVADARVESVMLPISDGLTLIRRAP
jgi:hypothetical protein